MFNKEGTFMAKKNLSFEELLLNAIKKCEGMYVEDFAYNFQLLYPFTTENISGYINQFDLSKKKLFTVGSSGDQVINANLFDCQDVTCFDLCPYTKFYIYLKIACLLELNRETFLNFLCSKMETFKKNDKVFQEPIYKKIKKTLRILDYESYLLWDELFHTFEGIKIREELFYFDENLIKVIIKTNPYLKNDLLYKEAREKIKKLHLNCITGNIFKETIKDQFDSIWLSNIGTYQSRHFVKIMTDKMVENLNENGRLLISYLFKTDKNTKYEEDWCPIYNLTKTFEILKDYRPDLISFIGVDGLRFHDTKLKDSILIYKKTK